MSFIFAKYYFENEESSFKYVKEEVFEEGKVGLEEGEFYPYPRY
jgi:hypothetical protein